MEFIYNQNSIQIRNVNTILSGMSIQLKNKLLKQLSEYPIIDKSFSYTTNTVKETLENYEVKLNISNVDKKIADLSIVEYYYLALILKISQKPKVLIVDGIISYLSVIEKKRIIDMAKSNNVTLLLFVNEFDYVYKDFEVTIFYEDKVAIYGDYLDVIKENKLLKRLGYEIPFYIDLSNELMLYKKIDNICYSKKQLEDVLWK